MKTSIASKLIVLCLGLLAGTNASRAADGSWTANANGAWTTAANWAGSAIADGAGFVAYFTNDITANRNVSLGSASGSSRTIGHLVISDADPATAGTWTLVRTADILTLSAGTTPTITVSNLGAASIANVRFPLAGTQGFNKEGAGTLQLGGGSAYVNTYSGLTTVNAGSLTTSSSNAGDTLIPGNLTINSGGNYTAATGDNIADTATVTVNAGGTFQEGVSSGKSETVATFVLDGGAVVQISTSTLIVPGNFDARNGTVSGGTGKLDVGTLTKSTTGTVTLGSRGSATAAGITNTIVNDGTLVLDYVQDSSKLLNTGTLTVNGGTLVMVNGSHTETVGSVTLTSGVMTNAGGTASLTMIAGNTYDLQRGAVYIRLGGGAGLRKSTANTVILGASNPFTGDTRLVDGFLTLEHVSALTGSTLDMDATDTGNLGFGSLTAATLGGLKGSRKIELANGSNAAVAASVGNNFQSTTYSGGLTGTGSLTKVGGGTLTLTGANGYSGTTTNLAGTLLVDGSIGPAEVRVVGGTLGGNGTITGPVVVQTGGRISPGSSVGLLTVNNSVTLESGSTTFVEIDKTAGTNDLLRVQGTLKYDGALSVTNTSLTPYVAGDSFLLFSASGGYSGNFAAITPAFPDTGLAWDTSTLNTDGRLRVAVAASTQPTITSEYVEGSNFILNGKGGTALAPFTVLCTTNVALPLSSWSSPGGGFFDGGGNFSFTNIFDPNGLNFYIIRVP